MSGQRRFYGLLLKALPAEFREGHRDDIGELLDEYTAGRPAWSRGVIVARAALDWLWVAVRLRIRNARSYGRRGRRKMEREGRASLVETVGQDIVRVSGRSDGTWVWRCSRGAYYAEALRLVRSASGVDAAGLTDVLPTAFNRRWSVRVPDLASGGDRGSVNPYIRVVSEGYVRAMGLPSRWS